MKRADRRNIFGWMRFYEKNDLAISIFRPSKCEKNRPFRTASSLLFVRDTVLTGGFCVCQVKKGMTEERKGRLNAMHRASHESAMQRCS